MVTNAHKRCELAGRRMREAARLRLAVVVCNRRLAALGAPYGPVYAIDATPAEATA